VLNTTKEINITNDNKSKTLFFRAFAILKIMDHFNGFTVLEKTMVNQRASCIKEIIKKDVKSNMKESLSKETLSKKPYKSRKR